MTARELMEQHWQFQFEHPLVDPCFFADWLERDEALMEPERTVTLEDVRWLMGGERA